MDYKTFKDKFQSWQEVTIAVVGDSTTCGFGSNPSPNTWTNGLEYGCVNLPRFGENWQEFLSDGVTPNPVYINTTGYPSQAQQDNINIPSGVRLLRTEVESRNANSKVYNFGGSGWTAHDHVINGTISILSSLNPKPELIIINIGINSAKNNLTQDADLNTIIEQVISNHMVPVLVKPNNIGVAYSTNGDWIAESTPDQWYPMDNWYQIRNGIDISSWKYGLDVIDLGTTTMEIDITKQYDSFHPNHYGYVDMFNKYINWMDTISVPVEKDTNIIDIKNSNYNLKNSINGELAIMTSNGIIRLKLTKEMGIGVNVKTSLGTYGIEK